MIRFLKVSLHFGLATSVRKASERLNKRHTQQAVAHPKGGGSKNGTQHSTWVYGSRTQAPKCGWPIFQGVSAARVRSSGLRGHAKTTPLVSPSSASRQATRVGNQRGPHVPRGRHADPSCMKQPKRWQPKGSGNFEARPAERQARAFASSCCQRLPVQRATRPPSTD